MAKNQNQKEPDPGKWLRTETKKNHQIQENSWEPETNRTQSIHWVPEPEPKRTGSERKADNQNQKEPVPLIEFQKQNQKEPDPG